MSLADICTRWGDGLVLATFAPGIPERTEKESCALATPATSTQSTLPVMATSRWTPARTIEGGKAHILSCPDSGQWVVVLK
ncbi:MAG: hypothetical protein U9R58_16220 [Chloroflexota bacterium]|nr:hypothetical protein [Chloroflexota bacterium]